MYYYTYYVDHDTQNVGVFVRFAMILLVFISTDLEDRIGGCSFACEIHAHTA